MKVSNQTYSINGFLRMIGDGRDLASEEAAVLFDLLRAETRIEKLIELLNAWREKGYTSTEIASCASILRREVKRVACRHDSFIDVVGTGGSRVKTFNVSTAAALVAAGAGLPVAKHGNRAASSKTGSADALSELGVSLTADSEAAGMSLNESGICFMFAPHFHNLTKELAVARKQVGTPTIFNLLGPIANPAGAPFQLIGIWEGSFSGIYAEAIRSLGTKRTWIVHGSDGLDEITLSGPTRVTEINERGVNHFKVSPSDFGLKDSSTDRLRVSTPKESAQLVRAVIEGYENGPARDLVVMNAGAALFIADIVKDLREGRALAEESLRSGKAAEKLKVLRGETD
ncbi:MAG: anthranilate phosphoribosyltransferase [Acidobacteria bacterium]|nr:MAG: anthranilate phosphoribosyltransferase [Acidobacteriota bacterium]REK01551.1 MAG: anthranilate phosphoribosyltransferase [Acidobacteriota bacterium]REK14507.1 MAG: anthranilate phosphoribosyltransferase [Acidobacteriota bacterium]REK45222.1 MAG: anthranilate phosphoribosyltransferase [Acidobacteriota bacterium]